MDKFKEEIIKALKKEVKADIELEVPPKPELGDYAFPCFSLAKTTNKMKYTKWNKITKRKRINTRKG